MGERELCKLEAIGSIPFTSTRPYGRRYSVKKFVLLVVAMVMFSAGNGYSACTLEEFQSELMKMQQGLTEVAKNAPEKLTALNEEMEKLFGEDMKELEAMAAAPEAHRSQEKQQALIEKSCELYKKINVKIDEFK